MKQLTDKQHQILEFITEFSSEHAYPPSVREICAAVGLRSPSTVHSHIKTLTDNGYITKDVRKTRTLSVGGGTFSRIPILGRVTAGAPILAVEEIEGYVSCDLGQSSGEHFALRVRGDSMIDAGIYDGDVIIVRKQQSAENGEIVVALLEDEATVKRLSRKNGQIWLMPENEAYSPIDGTNASILGKVVSLSRSLS